MAKLNKQIIYASLLLTFWLSLAFLLLLHFRNHSIDIMLTADDDTAIKVAHQS